MFLEIILFLILGIFLGIITGLLPGIHINLLGAILVSISAAIYFDPLYASVIIVAMAITHTFLDFIPSIILGCPDTDTELSLLPGHEMLKKGRGYEAIILTAKGSLLAIFYSIIFAFPLLFIFKKVNPLIQEYIPFILIIISIILILSEEKKLTAILVFSLTGFLGIISNLLSPENSLLPLLSGLFGSSLLIKSINEKTKIPPQEKTKSSVKPNKPVLSSFLISPFCSFLPGLGTGQAALISSLLFKQEKKENFLILVGATNTFIMIFSFVALYAIEKTRSGASVAIKEILGIPSKEIFIFFLLIILISGIISFLLTKIISEKILKNIDKLNYSKISIITLIFLTLIVILFSNLSGLLIFIFSTLTGLYCINKKVRKTNMMGSLIIPTIIWFLF